MLSRSAQRNVAGMQLIIADGNIVKSNASSVQLDTQATRIIHKFIERKHAIRTGALFKNSFDKIAQCRLSLFAAATTHLRRKQGTRIGFRGHDLHSAPRASSR